MFFNDFDSIENISKLLFDMQLSVENKALLDWLNQDVIDNEAILLNSEQAIVYQKNYYNKFINFMSSDASSITVGTQQYSLSKNYK